MAEAIDLGQSLDNLHQSRKEADYDLESEKPEKRGQAQASVERAVEIISKVNSCSRDEVLRAAIRQGIEDYKK